MGGPHGLAAAGMVTHANGTAECRASETMRKTKHRGIAGLAADFMLQAGLTFSCEAKFGFLGVQVLGP